jgi:hypothetical protein
MHRTGNRRYHRPSWSKTNYKKLGFDTFVSMGPDLAIIGSLNMILKTELKKKKWLMVLYKHQELSNSNFVVL